MVRVIFLMRSGRILQKIFKERTYAMVPKVDPPKFPEMLNAITENVRDSYAGMVFIDDPEDLD